MSRERGWTVEQLRDAVAASTNMTQVLRRLGLRPAGGNHKSIGDWITRLGLSTAHFAPDDRAGRARVMTPLADVLVERSTYQRGTLKKRLYAEGLKQRRCELCGQDERWRGARMSLILDHVNGVGDDNRLENLRIVCPNCAATLPTHCGRNAAIAREELACARCGGAFLPRYATQRYCSRACGTRHRRDRRPRPQTRKVERPPLAQLLAEVRRDGFAATGRRYGVSDNAIRKWILAAEREAAEREAAAG